MYALTIAFSGAQWVLLFNDEARAKLALGAVKNGDEVTDDFGQTTQMNWEKTFGMILENWELSKMAAIERGMHMARVQAKGNEMAMADPVLRAARFQNQQGPAVLSPMGNGRAGF